MAGQFDRFWNNVPGMLPGMIEMGIGGYGAIAGGKEANAKVDAAQGPLYQSAMGQAQNFLGRSTDPRAQAQQRLNAELGLLRDEDAMSEAKFMSGLQRKGMLDVTTYDTQGKPMDPKMYAFLKAREMRNAKLASDSMDKGEAAVTANINRAGLLNSQAGQAQNTGLAAQRARGSDTKRLMDFANTALKIGKDTGMLGMAGDWLKRQFGGTGGASGWDNYDFSVGDNSFYGF